jgi:hypothetical protein
MSRIRSLHPRQWTDEDFVECSMAARLLALGLRNEADDNGVFEWKPRGLKMKLFAADDVDVAALLEELAINRQVIRFEVDGRPYGAIRNFRLYQNPRTPTAVHPLPAEFEAYVGQRDAAPDGEKRGPGRPRKQRDAETRSSQDGGFPQIAENNSQREREREKKDISPSDSPISELTGAQPDAEPDPVSSDLGPLPKGEETEEAFDAFEAMRREIVPGCRSIQRSPDRRRKLAARLRDYGGLAGWRNALATIRGSPFLRGETSRNGFVAEIDWLLKPENLRKVLEGNYENRPGSRVPSSAGGPAFSGRPSTTDAVRAARTALSLG